jgi:hypothetical protein
VKVTTDLSITGKVAQFGRGAMADISDKLLGQFVDNLNTMILAGGIEASTQDSASETLEPQAKVEDDEVGSEATPTVRKIDAPEAEALDLLSVGGGTIAKLALPVVVIAAFVIWLIVK